MSNINTLNQLISEADQAYKQKILNIRDEIVPCIDIESRIEIAKKICWDKHGFMDSDEIILSMIEEHLIIRRWLTFLQFESKRQEKKTKIRNLSLINPIGVKHVVFILTSAIQ